MLGRTGEALECLHRAASLEPGVAKSYVDEAVALARLNRLDEAIAALDRDVEQRLGRIPQAIASLQRYLAARSGLAALMRSHRRSDRALGRRRQPRKYR
ncbi:MAG TPA: hypothetical protein VMT70_17875 [Vicinamibacteria bacterium]|nr:hypothetical protein [Vicinamibacteria bacterium]